MIVLNQNSPVSYTACSFDFEDGIGAWEKTGTAFDNQPTFGDNPTARNRETAKQEGDWWIGGAEIRPSPNDPAGRIQGDAALGTLTSPCFAIVGNTISFLIGGGCNNDSVRAELIVNNQVQNIAFLRLSVTCGLQNKKLNRQMLPSIKCSAAPPSFRLLPSTVPLSELCSTI